jgi:hypothetical protein
MTTEKKIRVALIYKKDYNYFQPTHFDRTSYDFFFTALQKNSELEMTYVPVENIYDVSKLQGKIDVILLPNNYVTAVPENLLGIQQSTIPVISRTGDPHWEKKLNLSSYHDKWKIDHYFGAIPKSYFQKFYPKEFKYKEIIFGLEPSSYSNLKPFHDRIKNRILNSGNVGKTSTVSRIANSILNPKRSAWYFYKLRTKCNYLSYVDHSSIQDNKYPNTNYPEYLSQYCAAIAATTYYPTQKYWEIPAASCLTFMEITETNDGSYLGFVDNETAIFINEKNYKKKFETFLADPNNPKWEEIATKGREYVFQNLSNNQATNSLVKLMREFI